jgi:hypothetical protein
LILSEYPKTVQELRTQLAVSAARAAHVFERTLLDSPTPMPPATLEANIMAHFGTFHGFALVEVLRMVEARGDTAFTEEVLATVNDIGANGDDGRCADVWPAVEAALSKNGIGTPAWDQKIK